jgi:glyoxylase-like metal-dependent hydrolase (beta-lactamase superfamily II)
VVVGDDGVLVFDAQATPAQAGRVIERVRAVTDKPVRYLVLSHYHAVRVMGASAYGAEQVIASAGTFDLIVERGQADFESEVGRFPRLFEDVASVPGLTWPTMAFSDRLTLWLGRRRVDLLHLGRGHTAGDIAAWLPEERVCFAGDLVEYGATPYCGDAHLRDWPRTLDRLEALGADKMVPGRGAAMESAAQVAEAVGGTRSFIRDLYAVAEEGVAAGRSLKEVYDAALERMRPSTATGSSSSTACRSTSAAPTTRRRDRPPPDLDGGARPGDVGGAGAGLTLAPLPLPPPHRPRHLDPEQVERPGDRVLHDVVDGLGLGVEGRDRRRDDAPHLGAGHHVAEVAQVERGLAHEEHEAAALLQDHVGGAGEQVVGVAGGDRGQRAHRAGGDQHPSVRNEPDAIEAPTSASGWTTAAFAFTASSGTSSS